MANTCEYTCLIVSKNKEAVQQMVNALKYQDFKNGYHLSRIFEADCDNGILEGKNGTFIAEVVGTCAWSFGGCAFDEHYAELHGSPAYEPKFEVWRDRHTKEIHYANIFMPLDALCRGLDCGVEVWTKERGYGFQEHYIVNSSGTIKVLDHKDWAAGFDTDESGRFDGYNPEKDEGGFGDEWGAWHVEKLIYEHTENSPSGERLSIG